MHKITILFFLILVNFSVHGKKILNKPEKKFLKEFSSLEIDQLTPLKYPSEKAFVPITKISKKQWRESDFWAIIPAHTKIYRISDNIPLVIPKDIHVKAIQPHYSSEFAYVLTRNGERKYKIATTKIINVSPDIDLKIKPEKYIEYKPLIKSHSIDKEIKLTNSLYGGLGYLSSSFYENFSDSSTTFTTEFGIRSALNWKKNIHPFVLLNASLYSVGSTSTDTFMMQNLNYGLGIQYFYFEDLKGNTSVLLGVEAPFSSTGSDSTGARYTFSHNTLFFSWEKVFNTKRAPYILGISYKMSSPYLVTAQDIDFPSKKESIKQVFVHVGFNFDITL